MSGTVEEKQVKILVVGDVKGQFGSFASKLNSLQEKAGPFELIICVGDFFGADDNENRKLLNGGFKFFVEIQK